MLFSRRRTVIRVCNARRASIAALLGILAVTSSGCASQRVIGTYVASSTPVKRIEIRPDHTYLSSQDGAPDSEGQWELYRGLVWAIPDGTALDVHEPTIPAGRLIVKLERSGDSRAPAVGSKVVLWSAREKYEARLDASLAATFPVCNPRWLVIESKGLPLRFDLRKMGSGNWITLRMGPELGAVWHIRRDSLYAVRGGPLRKTSGPKHEVAGTYSAIHAFGGSAVELRADGTFRDWGSTDLGPTHSIEGRWFLERDGVIRGASHWPFTVASDPAVTGVVVKVWAGKPVPGMNVTLADGEKHWSAFTDDRGIARFPSSTPHRITVDPGGAFECTFRVEGAGAGNVFSMFLGPRDLVGRCVDTRFWLVEGARHLYHLDDPAVYFRIPLRVEY